MGLKYVEDIGRILIEQLDIEQVVGERVALRRAGRNLKGLCPFHQEKTPSFVVSKERQSYHCFGCGASGNAIGFVMNYENLDFLTAIESLADRYSIDLTPYRQGDAPSTEKLDVFYDMHQNAARYYFAELWKSEAAQAYLKNRGLSEKTLRRFGVGYAPEGWTNLSARLLRRYSEKDIEGSGLGIRGKKGNFYDRFRGRIIFPIIDLRGRVIGFGGRVIEADQLPKYLNSPETAIFDKSVNLYGLRQAKTHASSREQIFLVEGYMDVVSLADKGVGNVVASLGTAFTAQQAKLLGRYTKQVILLYDGDLAGKKAAERAVSILIDEHVECSVVNLPDQRDPDNYVQEFGSEAFNQFIQENCVESWSYLLHLAREGEDLSQYHGKRNYLEKATTILNRMDSQALREIYLQGIADELAIGVEALKRDMQQIKHEPEKQVEEIPLPDYHQRLMAIVLKDPAISKSILDLPEGKYLNQAWQDILCFIRDHNGYNKELAIEHFSLNVCIYLDEAQSLPLSENDLRHWHHLFRQLLREEIHQKMVKTRQAMLSEEERIKELGELQQVMMRLKE